MKQLLLFALSFLITSSSFAAALFFDFQDPALARQLATQNGITLAPYISPSCQACNNTNYVLAGNTPNTNVGFPGPAAISYKPVKKVTLSIGEWYSPETWAITQGKDLSVTYRTSAGVVQKAIYPYPVSPLFLTVDAGPNAYLLSIETAMTGGAPYVPYIDNMTVYRDGDEEKVKLSIAQVRIAQRVFEPSILNTGTVDLVTQKPFATEVTISGTVPDVYKNLGAKAVLQVDGIDAEESAPFLIGDVLNSNAKAFIFASGLPTEGLRTLKVEIRPIDKVNGVFDDNSIVTASRQASFHSVKLNVIYNSISQCKPPAINCYSPPTSADISFFSNQMLTFAEQKLPISDGNLSLQQGTDNLEGYLNVGTGKFGVYKDLQNIWLQKKLAKKDVGISLVSDDYFVKQFPTLPNVQKMQGLTDENVRRVAAVRTEFESVLAHELVHVAGGGFEHDGPIRVEGIGEHVWTSGFDLASRQPFNTTAFNFFKLIDAPANETSFNLDRDSYNLSLAHFTSDKVDPKVILVAGILGANNQVLDLQMVPAETFLEEPPNDPDVTLEGLNSANQIIATVTVKSSKALIAEYMGAPSEVIPTTEQAFYATLADDGSITKIRIKKGTVVIATADVYPKPPLTFDLAMTGLLSTDFKGNSIVQKVALSVTKIYYDIYKRAYEGHRYSEARAILLVMENHLKLALNDEFHLADGRTVKKAEIIALIKSEIGKFPRK